MTTPSPRARRPQSLAVEITPHCNQRCRYCYNAWRAEPLRPGGEMSPALLERILDRVLQRVALKHVTFTGGEPLLHPQVLELVDLANARELGVAFISNGQCVDPALAEALASRWVWAVQLTLADAQGDGHDATCGEGSFQGVIAAAEQLQEAGVPVTGSVLVTRQSADRAGAMVERFAQLGVTHVAFNRFNPSGFARDAAAQWMPTRSQLLRALTAVDEVAGRFDLAVTCTMPIPPCMVEEEDYPHVVFGACSAGLLDSEPAVTADGQLKLCTLQADTLGDLSQSHLEELLAGESSKAFRAAVPEFCRGCVHESVCLGGCGAAARWAFGTEAALDPVLAQHVEAGYAEHLGRPADHLSAGLPAGDEAETTAQDGMSGGEQE